MIDIKVLNEIKDEKLWQIEEMVKALDGIEYWRDDFISYYGPANDVFERADNELTNIINSHEYSDIDENYIILALFLRETAYWLVTETIECCRNIECPRNILESYKTYLDCCFHKTEKQDIRRYETIEELRENLFERYKHNRNVKDSNEDNIRILKLLTLINEYEEIMSKNEF